MAHESTDTFLAIAQAKIAANHDAARAMARQGATIISNVQGGVSEQRAALVAMQIDETDTRISGTFVEADDTLKTIDRLSSEIQVTIMKILPVLARHEAMVQRLVDLRNTVAS